jgi:hypothetical protein
MIRASITSFTLTAGLLPLLAASSASGQEDGAFDRTPQDCITVSSIDETDAIDDQNIIFRMRGDRVFRNHLPRRCPGLERENRIAYRTTAGRLCNIDTITVLEQFGAGLRDGFTCRLGEFVPLSPAEVEDLDFREEGRAGQNAIETSSVELGRPEQAEATDEDQPAGAESSGAEEPAAEPPDDN